MTLESWRGTHQWGKGVTVYFPRRATWESDLAHLVRLMAGRPENVQKPVQGETYAGNGVSWRYEFHGDPGHDIDPGEVNRWYKAAALDNEARISVAEHVMENFGYDGEWWPVKEGHTDDPSYNEQMEPLRAFVAKVCGERVRTHVSNYMLDQAGNAQAMLTPVGTLVVRPGVSTMTVLHECAHYINRSTHGQGHDDAFIQIAADLYGRYIGADAKAKFLDLSVAPLGDRISSAAAIEANPVGTTFEHNNNTMEIIPFSDGVTWYLYVWDSPDVEGGMKYDIGYAKLKNGVLDEIKIDDAYRREGLATKLVDHIRAQVGGIGFHTDPGEYTPAGAAFTETVGRPSLDDGPPSAVWNPLSASISGSDDEFVFHL